MGTLNSWDITDANNNATPPDGWPENTMQYSEVNDTGRAVQGTLKRFFADINGSLAAAGAVNAYTLTLNETGYSAYFEGMYFACSIPITNTGATTINVNAIGAQTVITQSGSALAGGELQANGIYVFRYDGTNFQLMGSLGSTIGSNQATLSNANDPDLVDTNVALRVGAADPDASQHIEVGPSAIQSKSDQTTAALLTLQNNGGNLEVNSTDFLHEASIPTFDVNGTNGLAESRVQVRGGAGGLGLIANHLGGTITVKQTDSAGADEDDWLTLNRNGAVDLHHNDAERLSTTSLGFNLRSGSATSSTRNFSFYDNDGTTLRAQLRQINPGRFEIFNEINGAEIRLIGRDNGGTQRTVFNADPDGNSSMYYNGSESLRAQNPNQIGNITGGAVDDRLSTFRNVGFINMPPQIDNDGRTLSAVDSHKMLYTTSGIGGFTTAASTDNDWAGGDTMMLCNRRGSNISIIAGSGVTLRWMDGAGGATGTRTLADEGICTLYRLSAVEWWIWGVGLS